MAKIEDINKRIEDAVINSAEYYYACAEWCKEMAKQTDDKEQKDAFLIRGEFQKGMGDNEKR